MFIFIFSNLSVSSFVISSIHSELRNRLFLHKYNKYFKTFLFSFFPKGATGLKGAWSSHAWVPTPHPPPTPCPGHMLVHWCQCTPKRGSHLAKILLFLLGSRLPFDLILWTLFTNLCKKKHTALCCQWISQSSNQYWVLGYWQIHGLKSQSSRW